MKYVLALGAAFSFVVLGQEISIHANETDPISVESISNETYESESESFETFEIDTYSEESALKDGWNGDSSMYVLNGEYVKGLIEIDGNMYYFSENGIKQTGFVSYLGQTLYFDSTGKMVTGLQIIDGSTYYFEENGNMFTGFISISNEQVNYFGTDGKMVFGENIINGNHYYFDLNTGAMASGFVEIDGKTSYYNELGIKQFGNFSIDKDSYTTDENGIIIETVINGVTYYNQKDSQWANVVIGMGNIGSTGCVPTTATMVVNTITGTNYTPVDLGKYLYSQGVYNKTEIGTISTAWKMVANKYGLSYKNNLSYQDVLQALLEGHIVTGSVGYSYWCPWTGGTTHEIMMVGLDKDGYTTVYDPYNRDKCGRFLVSQVWNVKSKEDYDLLDKGPFFSLGYLRDYALYNNLETCGITQVSDAYYTGSNVTPNVSISYKNGNKVIYLTKDVDYTLSYENNKDIGKGSVIIQGIHNFFGKVTSYFDIIKEEIEEGTFEIHSFVDNSKVIDIKSGSFDSGAIVQIYDSNGTQAQKFEIVKLSDGFHAIKNIASGWYLLNVNSISDLKNGVGLYQGSLPSNNLNGRYIFKKDNNGNWIITSAWDNRFVIDLTGSLTSNGTRIQLNTCNFSNNQKWNLIRFKSDQEILDSLANENKELLLDRTYEFLSSSKTNYALDVASASVNNGANIQVYQSNGTLAQFFKVSHTDSGYVILTNSKSGKVITVEGNKVLTSANIVQNTYNGSKGQLWIVVKDGNGYKIVSALNSEYCIGYNGSNNVILTRYTNASSQKWNFDRLMSEYAIEYKDTIKDGTYEFAYNNSSVDIQSNSLSNGGNVIIAGKNPSGSQIWKVVHDSNGFVTFINYLSGKVLDVQSAKKVSGTNVQQYESNNTNAQKWIVVPNGNGYKIVSALNSNLYLNVSSNNVLISNSSNNLWSLVKTLSPEEVMDLMAKDNKNVLSEGYYEFSNVNMNKSLDVQSAKKENSVNVQLYQSNSTLAQDWKVTKTSDGYLILTNVNSGKVLDVYAARKYAGANVQQYEYNGTRAQLWVAVQGENGIQLVSALGSHLALGFNGTNVCLVSSQNVSNTTWNALTFKTQRDKLNDLALQHQNDVQEGVYFIASSINQNYVLDVKGASQSNSANVQLYQSNGTNAQKWKLVKDEKGYFTLISLCSNKALDVVSGKAVNSQNVQQYISNGTWAQKWILIKNSNGTYTFISAIDSNYVLDVNAGKAVNSQNVQIYTSNETKAQQFYLTKV